MRMCLQVKENWFLSWQEIPWDVVRSYSFPSKIVFSWLPQKKLVPRTDNLSVTKDCRFKIDRLSFLQAIPKMVVSSLP